MKYLLYPTLLLSLLLTVACEDDDAANYVFPNQYDATTEVFIEALIPGENSFLHRVHRTNGADLALPVSESAGALRLPLGKLKDFDPASNRLVSMGNGMRDLAFSRFTGNGGGQIDFLPLDFPDIGAVQGQPNQIMFGDTPNTAWINFGRVLLEGRINSYDVVLLTDSLAKGSLGLFRMLLDPAADKLYYFGRDRFWNPSSADSLIVFNAGTFEVEARRGIRDVFAVIQDPASDRIFGVTAPGNGGGFRLAEIIPSATNPVRIISSADLSIDNVSANLRAIHTASNSLLVLTGNNSIENPTNILISIDLSSGQITGRTDVLPGQIITGLYAE